MLRLWIVALLITTLVSAQVDWVREARLKNHERYFTTVMQETVYEIERREWCNLKLLDISQTLNVQMYDWLVAGTVNYTNGFVVSIQNIDIEDKIDYLFAARTLNGVTTHEASVWGILNLRDVEIGFDVVVDLNDEEENQHYTGSFTYLEIQIEVFIKKSLTLDSLSIEARFINLANGGRQMQYMPKNSLTEVLSRNFVVSSVGNGVNVWVRDIITPIVLDVANKTQFPEVCFKNC